ncbi:hypothetical protein J6590_012407 [Homalodisca vitripennis]|nr:hypothetical protein J6590_012407 [Homalodisca vitripennis]
MSRNRVRSLQPDYPDSVMTTVEYPALGLWKRSKAVLEPNSAPTGGQVVYYLGTPCAISDVGLSRRRHDHNGICSSRRAAGVVYHLGAPCAISDVGLSRRRHDHNGICSSRSVEQRAAGVVYHLGAPCAISDVGLSRRRHAEDSAQTCACPWPINGNTTRLRQVSHSNRGPGLHSPVLATTCSSVVNTLHHMVSYSGMVAVSAHFIPPIRMSEDWFINAGEVTSTVQLRIEPDIRPESSTQMAAGCPGALGWLGLTLIAMCITGSA